MRAKSDRREAFAALAAAIAQGRAATPCGFAGEKPVLAFPAHFLRLILAFHKFKIRLRLRRKTSGRG
jgi:hypothetical protein